MNPNAKPSSLRRCVSGAPPIRKLQSRRPRQQPDLGCGGKRTRGDLRPSRRLGGKPMLTMSDLIPENGSWPSASRSGPPKSRANRATLRQADAMSQSKPRCSLKIFDLTLEPIRLPTVSRPEEMTVIASPKRYVTDIARQRDCQRAVFVRYNEPVASGDPFL